MVHKLAPIGLFVVFLLGALPLQSASASVITSDGPVTLEIVETGEAGANALTLFGGEIECPGSVYTGHKYGVPYEYIPSGSSTITITPLYNQESCTTGEFPATVNTNGCDYVLHFGTAHLPSTHDLTADIVCPKESAIYIEVFAGESHGLRVCTQTIEAQSGLEGGLLGAHATDTAAYEDIDFVGSFRFIAASQSGLCGSSSTESAELHLDLTAVGVDELGSATGIEIS